MQPSSENRIESRGIAHLPRSQWWMIAGCLFTLICLVCTTVVITAAIVVATLNETTGPEARETAETTVEYKETAPIPSLTPESVSFATEAAIPTEQPVSPRPTIDAGTMVDGQNIHPPLVIEQLPTSDIDEFTLLNLLNAVYPTRGYHESATRLGSNIIGDRTVTSTEYLVGDRRSFSIDENEVQAELLAVTEHAYYWFESTLGYRPSSVADAARQFEATYYPLVSRLFGREWKPGVDNDPHYSVLHLDGYGDNSELGFFDSGDEYPRTVNIYSNEQELIYLNMKNLRLGRDLYFGTLAHELQHLFHWNNDSNEPTWMNEGLSQFIELYLGFNTVDSAQDYLDSPDLQLNSWNYDDTESLYAHYGASYLFTVYLWEQLGDQAIIDLVKHEANGLEAVYAILKQYRPETSLIDFMSQWSVANFLDNRRAGSQYGYRSLRLPRPTLDATVDEPNYETINQIHQYGVNYTDIALTGQVDISFAGDTHISLLPVDPPEGELMWYVPPIDELDAKLTAAFDLTGLNEANLEFLTWYDLEEEYDCAYLTVSIDGGSSWEFLKIDHASACEYGLALTGRSEEVSDRTDGWLAERISLNEYIDRQVLIRFEVLTDSAISGFGFAVDDISIPALGDSKGGEEMDIDWTAEGFVRTGSRLKQSWAVTLIQHDSSIPQVVPLDLNELNQIQQTVDLSEQGGTLVIISLTPFTTHQATYWLTINQ